MTSYSSYKGYDTETVLVEEKSSFIGWFVLVCFLLISIIVLIYFFRNQKDKLIDPNTCPNITGSYSVKPNKFGTVLRTCGAAGDKPCRSTEFTLSDAIKTCNRRSDICTLFSYNSNIGTMEILDPNLPLRNAEGVDVYERQIYFVEENKENR